MNKELEITKDAVRNYKQYRILVRIIIMKGLAIWVFLTGTAFTK